MFNQEVRDIYINVRGNNNKIKRRGGMAAKRPFPFSSPQIQHGHTTQTQTQNKTEEQINTPLQHADS